MSLREKINEEPLKLIEIAIVAAGILYVTWANAAKVPDLQKQVGTQETRLTVVESKVDDIRADVKAIRWAVVGRGRKEQP